MRVYTAAEGSLVLNGPMWIERFTPLTYAVVRSREQAIKMLLAKPGVVVCSCCIQA